MTISDKPLPLPAGYYRTTEEWAAVWSPRGNEAQAAYLELYKTHRSAFRRPVGLDDEIPQEFHDRDHQSAFVAVIPGGRLWGAKGAVIAPDNRLLFDVSLELWGEEPERHSVFRQPGLPPVRRFRETWGVLTYTASDFYFHWMLDVLPRIALIRQTGIAPDKYVVNTHAASLLPFQDETLAMIGIPPEARVVMSGQDHLQAERLLVPSLIGVRSHYPEWAIASVRAAFAAYMNEPQDSEFAKIYVSREDAQYRNVTNEEQVADFLAKYGYKKIVPSEWTVKEQIHIFASARRIVAPHGSNLTNLLFCRPGAQVLEIFSPHYINAIYWVLSNHARLDYYYVLGSKRPRPRSLFEMEKMQGKNREQLDIEVDLDRLGQMMRRAGMEA
ncbi:glycosyltransferase family 61 protein [Paenibacillus ginsengihumi]|uniref:glycosyltransferase family 61 protein n=1 Tax=Paenibacillus ginsengihumi TaxID=431596 RepID=UPI00035F1155|nr:glycosyltransferase family 61 protein [Paenibacillus ginsengihumi]